MATKAFVKISFPYHTQTVFEEKQSHKFTKKMKTIIEITSFSMIQGIPILDKIDSEKKKICYALVLTSS
jgi:hypothetical protein